MSQQEWNMNLYSFNKASCPGGYGNKGQHFEKLMYCPSGYDNKTWHFVGEVSLRCLPQRFSGGLLEYIYERKNMNKYTAGQIQLIKMITTVMWETFDMNDEHTVLYSLISSIWALHTLLIKEEILEGYRIMKKDYEIAVAGTGARDIIGSTKKNYDN